MIRPIIRKGDLVRRKKPYDDGSIYRVLAIRVPEKECRRLGMLAPLSSEGFLEIMVGDRSGRRFHFKRRELWRIPNQPREKVAGSVSTPTLPKMNPAQNLEEFWKRMGEPSA